MKLGAFVKKIEAALPLSWAEEWDSTGLAVGDTCSDVARVAVALDASEETVLAAAELGCGVLFSHHPSIFRPLESLVFDMPVTRAIRLAVKNEIALYSAHTNWDVSPEGVNAALAKALGLKEAEPLLPPAAQNGAWGLGIAGTLEKALKPVELLSLLKKNWSLSRCEAFGDFPNAVQKIAICGGSCGKRWRDALERGAETLITADVSYHDRQDALAMGFPIIEADHGEMERVSLPALRELIERETSLPAIIIETQKTQHVFL